MLVGREQIFLTELEGVARDCRGVRVQRSASGITVAAQSLSGFDMSVWVVEGVYQLTFDGWTEDFEDGAVAARLFVAALRGEARLKIDCIGGQRWRWTLETLCDGDRWHPQSTIGHAIWRLWGQRSVIHLRNAFAHRAPGDAPAQPVSTVTCRCEPTLGPLPQPFLPPSVA